MYCYGRSCSWSWHLLRLTFFLNLWITLLCQVYAFNYSPQPNLIINDPELKTFNPQTRSSYFGYTIVMRPNSVFIGAPRAQSTVLSQSNINETGALYRCSLQKPSICNPYILEDKGNIDGDYDYTIILSEKRDFQWLGGAMDGGTKDTDKLIVCAPRFRSPTQDEYYLHGICYWVKDTLSNTTKIERIRPLIIVSEQVIGSKTDHIYKYAYAEEGFSAHVTPDNQEFLIGAPGIYQWNGGVINFKQTIEENGPISRRDTTGRRVIRQSYKPQINVYSSGQREQRDDSYIGYSVSSGYFDSANKKKLLYVATAPQGNRQSGEAYIFDIVDGTMKMEYVFRGTKFGEYFGYAVLAVDLTNDGLTDVIISAPQYSVDGFQDDGAIYVFVNLGTFEFERKLLVSPDRGNIRFGTTLSNLGDINGDKYNDIAVGAPFAGNGSVFIYLGNQKGLRDRASQRLDSPATLKSSFNGKHFYGHGLSKGSDYDGNGFNDLAIGAPNAEAVLIYRAYPVVKIHATISSNTREIKPEQGRFQIKACYSLSTVSNKITSQEMTLRVVVDPYVKRVRLLKGTTRNEVEFNVTGNLQTKCQTFDAEVGFIVADIFKPIELEIHYNLVKSVPDSEEFCETCAAVDPHDEKMTSEKISFSTGCVSDICVADLVVKSLKNLNSFILGSSKTIQTSFEISNNGEKAYLPQINITSSNHMPFAKIPSNCKVVEEVILQCDLNDGHPLQKSTKTKINVSFDSSDISGKEIIITAEAFSTGNEKNHKDNILKDVIILKEFSNIEIVGKSSTPDINLEQLSNITQIVNNYEVKSFGPSTISDLEVIFSIPVAYRVDGSRIPIIDAQHITMDAQYNEKNIKIDFYENNTQLLMNAIENHISSLRSIQVDGTPLESFRIGHVNANEVNAMAGRSFDGPEDISQMPTPRRRRRNEPSSDNISSAQYAKISKFSQQDALKMLTNDQKSTLHVNRTVVFDCHNPETTVCVRAILRIRNFIPEKPLTIKLNYKIDLNVVNKILVDPWEFFVILIGLDLKKMDSDSNIDNSNIFAITNRIEYNIISKHQLHVTPLWVYILAILGGLLILSLMTYGMYKLGFFKRATKEEMEQLVNQNKVVGDEAPETANLNSDHN